MADFVLTLGDFSFQDREVPQEIAVGGVQKLVPHQIIGGIRVVDAMGRIDDDLEWSGWLLGPNAGQRRDYLEAYKNAGAPLILTWSTYRYQVLVQRFSAKFQREYQYLYQIAFTVVADLTNTTTQGSAQSLDDSIGNDLGTAQSLTSAVGDSTLSSLMGTVSSAIGAVETFTGAAKSVLNSVIQPIAATAQRVSQLAATVDSTISHAAGFAGIVAGGSGASMSVAFSAQISAVTQQTNLAQLSGVLGRMNANLTAAGSSDNVVTVGGGNLFSLAASEYGNANDWTAIAQANDLSDPFVDGTQQIVVPASPADTDGVLGT